jgi:uncharacterized protein (DUF1697 family)
MRYIAFLRGVNVGGNGLIKMSELAEALSKAGLQQVKTYIQSGNVLFDSPETDTTKLAERVTKTIQNTFKLSVDSSVFSKPEWQQIIAAAPKWWGKDAAYKHNVLILTTLRDSKEIAAEIGELKPDIETMQPGNRVLYQSLSWDAFSRTTGGKLAAKPVYKQMTIRNYNTATKLAKLLEQENA